MSFDLSKYVSVPSLDRPFGFDAWSIFEKFWQQFSNFSPADFRFVPGTTPMGTFKETATVLVSYYIIIFGGRELMRGREPFKFNPIFKAHNLFLTIISGVLLTLFIEELLPTLARNGIFYAICDANGGWTKRLVTLYYVSLPIG